VQPPLSLTRVGTVKNLVRLLGIILLASNGVGQSASMFPEAPEPQPKFWTRGEILLATADAAAKSADMVFTMQNARGYDFVENDPVGRPFVTHGRAIAGVSQGALFLTDVFLSYQFHKHGHPRLAKAVLICGFGLNSAGASGSAWNLTHK